MTLQGLSEKETSEATPLKWGRHRKTTFGENGNLKIL